MRHPVGRDRSGVEVYVDLISSAAGKQIARQPQLLSLAEEMLGKVKLHGAMVSMEYDMKRPVGYSFVVETSSRDLVFYACLQKDEVYTRFVKDGKPTATPYIAAIFMQDDHDAYELYDVQVGHLTPPAPGSANETTESKPYWLNHAFIMDSQPFRRQTVVRVCPY
jgi:hypothetical protein